MFAIELILGLLIGVMIIVNFIQMLTRYFINISVSWVEDFSILGLYWLFGLGVPLAWIAGGHMEMNILENLMSRKFKLVISYITQVFGVVMGVVYIVTGMRSLMLNKGYVMSIMGFDEMWRYVPVVVCGVLLILASIFNFAELIVTHGESMEKVQEEQND